MTLTLPNNVKVTTRWLSCPWMFQTVYITMFTIGKMLWLLQFLSNIYFLPETLLNQIIFICYIRSLVAGKKQFLRSFRLTHYILLKNICMTISNYILLIRTCRSQNTFPRIIVSYFLILTFHFFIISVIYYQSICLSFWYYIFSNKWR